MNLISRIIGFLRVPKDQPELVQAQLKTFSRQIPLMYGMVIVNTIALAWVHVGHAPALLSIYVPGGLVALSVVRILGYWRAGKQQLSNEKARHDLQTTVILAGILGAIFSIWALTLFPYGTPFTQGQVTFFSGITSIGIMVCLMHLRSAALILALAAVAPQSIFLAVHGGQVFTAVALNLAVVAVAVLIVLFNYSRDFEQMVAQQQALIKTAQEARDLSDANFNLANLDSLTDIPNRRNFFAELRSRLNSGKANSAGLAVGVIDLDGFKPINDLYGHGAGDRLLMAMSKRLSDFSKEVFVARLGGDEFGLLISGLHDDEALIACGRDICAALAEPIIVDGFTARMSCSIGLAKYPDAADSAELLFERADYALYYAKEHAKGDVVLFSDKHEALIREISGIDQRLREADLEAELSLAFQLVYDTRTGKAVAAEALARWHNEHLGSVSPCDFIPSAERSGLITQLTEVLLRKTLTAAAEWPEHVGVSFNLSARDLTPERMSGLIDIVQASSISSERLTFEITETAIMQDFERSILTLKGLKKLGVKIALDDFGTGYSSLSYVRALPLDRLKVDRSFITEIETDKAACAVVRTVIDLTRNLDLECVIEGVETRGQLDVLEDMGCSFIQGYLFSRPIDGTATLRMLNHQNEHTHPEARMAVGFAG